MIVSREPTISAYIQCFSNKTALYETLRTFRQYYPSEKITLVSDCGEDFSKFASYFDLYYYRSEEKCDPRGNLGKAGVEEYLSRIYDHCLRVTSDYVVILEEDVITGRRIRRFPKTDCGGPRLNFFTKPLIEYVQRINGTSQAYGYAMCGGSIFDRRAYIASYENKNIDFDLLQRLDERVVQYSDAALTAVFLVNGYSYGVWEEVSESNHPDKNLRIFRDAAFDHNNKKWYGVDFDEALLTAPRMGRNNLDVRSDFSAPLEGCTARAARNLDSKREWSSLKPAGRLSITLLTFIASKVARARTLAGAFWRISRLP